MFFGCLFAWFCCIGFLIVSIEFLIIFSSNNSCRYEVLTKKGDVYYAYSKSGKQTVLTREKLRLIECNKNVAIDTRYSLASKKILGYIYPEDINKFEKELSDRDLLIKKLNI